MTKLSMQALAMYRHADRVLGKHVAKVRIACRAGCTWCCHFDVEVSQAEAEAIAGVLRVLPRRDRQARVQALRDADLSRAGMDGPMDRYYARIPCALLVDGRCSVYSVRPLLCRGYLSTDREGCQKGFEDRQESDIIASALNIASVLQNDLGGPRGHLEAMVLAALGDHG